MLTINNMRGKYTYHSKYNNLKIQKKIPLRNEKFIQNIIFKLIYLKKINFIYYISVKQNINISYTDTTTKIK